MKRSNTLYNMIMPVWMLLLWPISWPVTLLGNFGVDSLVLYLGMRRLKVEDKKAFYKKHIFKVWGCGFLGDLPGVIFLYLSVCVSDWFWVDGAPEAQSAVYRFLYDRITTSVMTNPFTSIWAFLWVTAAVGIAALCIYFLNIKLCYKNSGLDQGQKKRMARWMALITAPWLFYLPTTWFYF